jgi:hypothetical protein
LFRYAVTGLTTPDLYEVQTTELAIFLHGLVTLFFEDRPPLVMHLMLRSEPLGGRLDLGGPTYPHVHRESKDGVRRKLVQVDVEC